MSSGVDMRALAALAMRVQPHRRPVGEREHPVRGRDRRRRAQRVAREMAVKSPDMPASTVIAACRFPRRGPASVNAHRARRRRARRCGLRRAGRAGVRSRAFAPAFRRLCLRPLRQLAKSASEPMAAQLRGIRRRTSSRRSKCRTRASVEPPRNAKSNASVIGAERECGTPGVSMRGPMSASRHCA